MMHSHTLPLAPVVKVNAVEDEYELTGETLGQGGHAVVVGAVQRSTGKSRAIKIFDTEKLRKNEAAANRVVQETEILRSLNHKNIIKVEQVVVTDRGDKYLVMERLDSDLYDHVRKQPGRRLSEDHARKITRHILHAIVYLHLQGIVHRDLKPENVLLNSVNDVRIADFGVAKVATVSNTPVGTSYYMAPEIVRNIELQGRKAMKIPNVEVVKFIDMWALGCVLYFMLCGKPPFVSVAATDHGRRMELLRQIDKGASFEGERWAGVSEEAKDFINRLLTKNARNRLNAEQAQAHGWLAHVESSTADSPPAPPAAPTLPQPDDNSQSQGRQGSDTEASKQQVGHHLTDLFNEVAASYGEVPDTPPAPDSAAPAAQSRLPCSFDWEVPELPKR
ncbi:putative serine/threonine-protein kinase fhkD [Diplonema papillatum]|nr:putative serine/threonine-protein kinase fhkD [Diplonema papillatum]